MVRDLEAFKAWLIRCGAEILAPTSMWEVLRVRTFSGVHVVHRNRKGRQRWPDGLVEIADLFLDGGNPALSPTARTRRSSHLRQRYPVLRARDGAGCFYCGSFVPAPDDAYLPDYEPTVEHLVPIAHGGPNHLSNTFLAHKRCNNIAGNLSAVEKITLREKMREAKNGQ
ncbi:HNH endonuclease [Aureimonas sp. AU40]|uniref:HNH endonuclease n=1 Tax=Aureimonas sp. AU40 TaxID=1637747 RepID=UPI00078297B9|nr:HNH endonuclease signature motif containing protein [Aureimonas sp. AU40]